MGKKSTATKNAWNARKYDQVRLLVTKGEKEAIKANAEKIGKSMNEFIKIAIAEKINKSSPCFVHYLDRKIEVSEENVKIPIGLKNKTNIPAFHIQLCQLDNGEYVKSSDLTAKHNIKEYLSNENASKDETIYFVVSCDKKLLGCDIYFTVRFSTKEGSIYKQNFRIQYSSILSEDNHKGIFSQNCWYGLPYPEE